MPRPRKNARKKPVAKRQYKKKKPVNKGNLRKRNLQPYIETKQREFATAVTVSMDTSNATTAKPQATTIIVPQAFKQGLTQGLGRDQFVGNSVFDRYLVMKCEIDFDNVPPITSSTLGAGIDNIRYIQGWITQTQKDATPAQQDAFVASNWDTIVGHNLLASDVGSTYLKFSEKWKNIKVLKRGVLRPKSRTRNYNPGDAEFDPVEPIQMKFAWNFKRKNLLEGSAESEAGEGLIHQRFNSYVPFLIFYSASLHGHPSNEVPQVSHISKLWFSDS